MDQKEANKPKISQSFQAKLNHCQIIYELQSFMRTLVMSEFKTCKNLAS